MSYNPTSKIRDLDPMTWAASGTAIGALSGLLSSDTSALEGSALGGAFGTGSAVGHNIGASIGSLVGDYYGKDPKLGGIIGAGAGLLGGGFLASSIMKKLINRHDEKKRRMEYKDRKIKEYQNFLDGLYGVKTASYITRVQQYVAKNWYAERS